MLDFLHRSSWVPQRLLASSVTSFMSMTPGSYWDSVAMYWIRSWPCPAWISAAMRVGICAWSMWSTTTFTPTFCPHALANWSNHVSWLGTKWLHRRIFRSPESFLVGSVKVSLGAWLGSPPGPPGPASSSLAQPMSVPPSVPPSATAPAPRRRLRRLTENDGLSTMTYPPSRL